MSTTVWMVKTQLKKIYITSKYNFSNPTHGPWANRSFFRFWSSHRVQQQVEVVQLLCKLLSTGGSVWDRLLVPIKMLLQCTLHLNRSGSIFSILVGCCRMCMPPVSALPSVVASMRSDYSTAAAVVAQARRLRPAWAITNRKGLRPIVTVPRQHILSAREDCSARVHGVETKLESDGTTMKATLEMIVSSPQEMEETGAFLAADSGGGDVVLLSGWVEL